MGAPPARRSLAGAALALALLTTAPPAAAEPVQLGAIGDPPERLEGLVIDEIRWRLPPGEDQELLLALTGLAPGQPFALDSVRRAVRVLFQLDRFENVYVTGQRRGNGVALELFLPPRPRVQEIRLLGSELLGRAEIEELASLKVGQELDMRALSAQRRALVASLVRRGHRSAAVGAAVERLDEAGGHALILRVDEGPRTRLGQLHFAGHPRRPEAWLRSQLGLSPGEVLDLSLVEAALAHLLGEYRRLGFLEVSAEAPVVRPQAGAPPEAPVADLLLAIDAGPELEISFTGHEAISRRELEEDAALLAAPDGGAGAPALAEVRERITARYLLRGYWRARVKTESWTAPDGSRRRIRFLIEEGPRSYVAALSFPGNRALAPRALEDRVYEIVEQVLSEDLGRPGADFAEVAALIGRGSLARSPRARAEPDGTPPDPRRVYVARAYGAAADALADLYRAEGYQTVDVSKPELTVRKDNLLDVRFPVREGVRWRLGSVSFSGNEALPASTLFAIAEIEPAREGGEPLAFAKVEDARRALLARYKNDGYLYARVSQDLREVPPRGSLVGSEYVSTSSAAPLDVRRICQQAEQAAKEWCDVELVFRVSEGPQVRARNVLVRGLEDTRPTLVDAEIAVREGQVLTEADMVATRTNLLRIGVFERVTVAPLDEKEEAAVKDVVCELRERKHSFFEAGGGASTEEGLRVFASYGHNNLFGTAVRFQTTAKINYQPLTLFYGESVRANIDKFYSRFAAWELIEGALAVGVSYPRIFGLPPGFGAGLDVSAERSTDPAYAEDRFSASVSGTYTGFRPTIFERARPLTLQLRANFDYSVLTCNPDTVIAPSAALVGNICSAESLTPEGTSIYTSAGPLLRWDLTDDPLDPAKGVRFEISARGAKGLDSTSPDFVKLDGKLDLYVPLLRSVGLAFSVVGGRIFALEEGAVPVNQRFVGGGSETIRGYPQASLFPHDLPPADNQKISPRGLFLLALRSELRFPVVGALSGAFFYDAGDLLEDPANFSVSSSLRQGVGAGLRYATPVGPMSLDFGFPLVLDGFPGQESGLALHFSIRSF